MILFSDLRDTRICKINDFCISDMQILSKGQSKTACEVRVRKGMDNCT